MKKSTARRRLAIETLESRTLLSAAPIRIVDFEDIGAGLGAESNWHGPDPAGTPGNDIFGGRVIIGKFTSAGTDFANTYSTDWGSWADWAYSNVTDNTTPGYLNQFSAFPGHGVLGSPTYGVAYADDINQHARITMPVGYVPVAAHITNTTYAAKLMLDGDPYGFAKRFGGATGTDPDWFLLTITGKDLLGNPVGTPKNFYMADYRSPNSAEDYVVADWRAVDLSGLAGARVLEFGLTSSDNDPMWGMNTPAYFAMDNLVLREVPTIVVSGDTVTITGTSGEDFFGFSTSSTKHTVTVNGTRYEYDPAVIHNIRFDGAGGLDTITVFGGAHHSVEARLGETTLNMLGPGYEVHGVNVETKDAISGNGANDRAFFAGSAGDDAFYGQPVVSYMLYAVRNRSRVTGFDRVEATAAAGGLDAAYLFDSAGNDIYTGSEGSSRLYRPGEFDNVALGFPRVYAHSTSGTGDYDTATISDTTGTDRFIGTPVDSYVHYSGGKLNFTRGFNKVEATATTATDTAWLYDSPADDTFRAWINSSTLAGSPASGPYENAARGFRSVYAFAMGGGDNDQAFFHDSAGNDTFVATPGESYLRHQTGELAHAKGFDKTEALATDGFDTAVLRDSVGNDLFTAGPAGAVMRPASGSAYHNTARGFDRVHTVASLGENDQADLNDSAGDDRFTAWPERASMLLGNGPGTADDVEILALAFDRVIGHATLGAEGDDWAIFFDSPGNDAYTGGPHVSSMLGPKPGGAFDNSALGFDRSYAYSQKGGHDTATLVDSALRDLIYGHGQTNEVYIRYSPATLALQNYAKGFKRVTVQAAGGGNDSAYLFDSVQNDTFTGQAGWGEMTDSPVSNLASYFFRLESLAARDEVKITSSKGGADRVILPAPTDYTLVKVGPWQQVP